MVDGRPSESLEKGRKRRRVLRSSLVGRSSEEGPHPVDVYVGLQLRSRRALIGWSQEQLGAAIGLTFQQVQKYERGANRICASRLYSLAMILDVPVSYFFEGLPPDGPQSLAAAGNDPDQQDAEEVGRILKKRETLELVRAYYRIPVDARRNILDMTRALAELPEHSTL